MKTIIQLKNAHGVQIRCPIKNTDGLGEMAKFLAADLKRYLQRIGINGFGEQIMSIDLIVSEYPFEQDSVSQLPTEEEKTK